MTFNKTALKHLTLSIIAIVALAIGFNTLSPQNSANAAVTTGELAPNFTATDTNGNAVSLEDMRGKTVVLEWVNYGCPYVRKHYDTNNMQELQTKYTEQDVVWVGIVSSAEGKEGFLESDEAANAAIAEENATYTHFIRDPSGELGKLYNAKVTPHMYVIDDEGMLVYQGAIDDKPSVNPNTIEGATNHVDVALTALQNGEAIEVSTTKAYGCSVKY